MEFNTAYGSVWMVCGVCNESGVVWGVVCKVLCCGLLGFWDLWDFFECLNILNIFIWFYFQKKMPNYILSLMLQEVSKQMGDDSLMGFVYIS